MSVNCWCYTDDAEYWFCHTGEFDVLETSRRKRCHACRVLIDIGADCGILSCTRAPLSDIDEAIHGDEIPMANKYLCEECYGLLLSVEEYGGCVMLEKGEPLKDAVREWAADK